MNKAFIILLVGSIIWSCTPECVDYVDPFDPALPAFGFNTNTYGALINSRAFTSGYRSCECYENCMRFITVTWIPDSNRIELRMPLINRSVDAYPDNEVEIIFQFYTENVRDIFDLEGKIFDLSEENHTIEIQSGNPLFNSCSEVNGKFSFLSIKPRIQPDKTQLTGTFGFDLKGPDCDELEVYQGRFNFIYNENEPD